MKPWLEKLDGEQSAPLEKSRFFLVDNISERMDMTDEAGEAFQRRMRVPSTVLMKC